MRYSLNIFLTLEYNTIRKEEGVPRPLHCMHCGSRYPLYSSCHHTNCQRNCGVPLLPLTLAASKGADNFTVCMGCLTLRFFSFTHFSLEKQFLKTFFYKTS
jgi:hypothetical protein